jgi:hypothetical protein
VTQGEQPILIYLIVESIWFCVVIVPGYPAWFIRIKPDRRSIDSRVLALPTIA